ncbi:MFS transporter [Sphingomonas hylomeconis]|uniref:MFS transporter n=1 Tax=Sphingomonas hylomeconis TaxID=1395958 RepID=A0ABV7SV11_9SPHN|nr:MFS transporter [Sphingomonas hylomeconis]
MAIDRWRLAAFTAPAFPIAAAGLPLTVHLPPYYAGTLGLNLALVGLIFVAVRIIDLPFDLLFGQMLDRARWRWGRFRPWFVIGAVLMTAFTAFVFMARPGISPLGAFGGLLGLYIGMSLFLLTHLAWAATLTDVYHDRSRIFGWIQAATVLGLLVVLALPPLTARLLHTTAPAAGIHAMGVFLILTSALSTILVLATTPERAMPPPPSAPVHSDFARVLVNALMRRLLLADLLAGLATGVLAAMFIFVFEHRLRFDAATASALLLPYFLAGLVAAPLWMKLAYRIGKHRTAGVAGVLFCITATVIAFLPPGNVMVAIPVLALAGMPFTAFPFLMRAMLADVLDVERRDSGRDCTGLFSATLVMTTKIAHALPVGLVYPLLALIGFQAAPGAINSDAAIAGLVALFVALPLLLMAAAVWVVWRWPLDQAAHAAVVAELALSVDPVRS